MARPDYNPPNNDCPECTAPSKTFSLGGRTVDGIAEYRWQCEHGHEWVVTEKREVPPFFR